MRPSITSRRGLIPLCAALASAFISRGARGGGDWEGDEFSPPPPFELTSSAIGDVRPASATPAHLASSRIVPVGAGSLVIDADSGALILADAKGASVAQLAIGTDAGLLAYDDVTRRAYVADRRGDRIVVVGVGEKLAAVATWKTPAEPYGVALTPDRSTVIVTTVADRTLVAFDAKTGREAWRHSIAAEARGLAISPDGKRVAVASLTSGTLEQIALDKPRPSTRRVALPVALDGQRARGSFAVAFLGDRIAVAPYQLETPVAKFPDSSGQYGGSFLPPISHHLAFFGEGRQAIAQTNVHEPRAIAWDAARDTLYIAGLASDDIVAVGKASQVDVMSGEPSRLGQRCGADGLAIASDGDVLVWCSFTRSIARFEPGAKGKLGKVQPGAELVASKLDEQHHDGFVAFHSANEDISGFGQMSCGNCHLDGRADGLSWRIKDHELQTPMLAGRLAGTGPFKWDGTAPDLPHSLRATVRRLGGNGLSRKRIAALAAYLESLPAVRTPTRNAFDVTRGKQLFESAELGCASCHEGRAFTDRDRHQFGGTKGSFDTPSLIGLAASAPYFHDGSATTLEAVLRDRGKVHGMSEAATALSDAQLADLTAFLETL